MRNTLFWLFYLIIFYVILFLMDILPLHNPKIEHTISMIVRITPSILFIFLFTLFAQNQEVPKDKKPEKYKKSGTSEGSNTDLFRRIENYLKTNKIYLDPDFNLDLLVEHIGETRHKISEAINQEYNDNFYAYINGLRLKEFLHVIETDKFPNYTILAIAYECGFKSTSAFYSYFKKVTGKTPKQYIAAS